MTYRFWSGLPGILLACGVAHAETLPIAGIYPAESDGGAAMRSIAIEQFGGSDGPELSIRIGDALQDATISGQRYFRILAGGGSAYGVLRGTATAEISRER